MTGKIEGIIMVVLVIFLATALIGDIADEVEGARGGNVTGSASTILNLVKLVFAMGIVVLAIRGMIGKGK